MRSKNKVVAAAAVRITKRETGPCKKYGVGDLGSNKFHFCVCDENGKVIKSYADIPALGDRMADKPPFFKKEHLNKAIKMLKAAAKMFREHNVAPENVHCYATAALRDVEAFIEKIKQAGDEAEYEKALLEMNALRVAFAPYSFDIISGQKEALLVARSAIDELLTNPEPAIEYLAKAYTTITVIHGGGRSTEVIRLASGEIDLINVLDCGLHTHKSVEKENPQDAGAAGRILHDELAKSWPCGDGQLLALSGGIARNIGRLICAPCFPVIARKEAEQRLIFLARQDDAYFKEWIDKRRIPYMKAGIEMRLQMIRYTDAAEIVFLQGKMVNSIIPALRDKAVPAPNRKIGAQSPARKSGQLSVPSAP